MTMAQGIRRLGMPIAAVLGVALIGLFATITAVLDRLGLSVQDARVVTSRSGMSLDTFLVLDAQGRALHDAAQVGRLQRGLTQALEHAGKASRRERRGALGDKDERRLSCSRCSRRNALSSSPQIGCVLGVPFLTRRTASVAALKST